jgi:subtilisin family serine protease
MPWFDTLRCGVPLNLKRVVSYLIFIIAFVSLLGVGGHTQQPATRSSGLLGAEYVDGELLVKYKSDAAKSRASIEQIGSKVIREFPSIGWEHVRLPAGMNVAEALDQYKSLPGVALVQPNFIYHTLITPNDPQFGSLYGLSKIQAPQAWDTTTGRSSVVVADIDLGVDYNHEDLKDNMWRNPGETGLDANGNDKATNGIDDDGDGYIDDVYGIDTINHDSDPVDDSSFSHGTHTSGTIGAVGNNAKGVVGVNWTVRIMAIKSHDASGNGTSASVVEAFNYATMMRQRGANVRATNSSWGGAPEAASYDQALKDAIDAAGNAGIVNVCAAGNGNNNNDVNPFYPASYDSPSIISVAASDSNDNKAGFSSYGATSVDLAAPGSGILSTIRSVFGSYGFLSGTSMAAPHVTGAAALLCSYNPNLTVAQIKSTLLNSVDVLPQWSGLTVSGGRLNVAKALQMTPMPTPANGTISGIVTEDNGRPVEGTVIRLSGTQNRKIITDANGAYHFDNVEPAGFYTVTPSRANYNFNPASRSFSQLGNKTEAAFTATATSASANPLDTNEYFVRQQYVDLLGREPDEGGFNYWSDQLNACGADANCIRARHISVGAAFFVEQEFQQSGAFIYDVYSGTLGRRPSFAEYSTDRRQVVGGPNLEAEKTGYANSFVERAEFITKYAANQTGESFVDALIQNVRQSSGVDLSGARDTLISAYQRGASLNDSRAAVVRALADNAGFSQSQYNAAFVLTEYFGYLRRDFDQGGYDFWLNVLNNREPNNYLGMVCAFVTSIEYQLRFGPAVTHTNAECR